MFLTVIYWRFAIDIGFLNCWNTEYKTTQRNIMKSNYIINAFFEKLNLFSLHAISSERVKNDTTLHLSADS